VTREDFICSFVTSAKDHHNFRTFHLWLIPYIFAIVTSFWFTFLYYNACRIQWLLFYNF